MSLSNSQNPPPPWRARIFTGWQADAELRRLGIPGVRTLARGLLAGASGARAATGLYFPVTYPGERMWGETHGEVARQLSDQGFEAIRVDGVDVIVNSRLGTAIIVTAGSNVGDPAVPNPQPRYKRKSAVQRIVNGETDSLFAAAPRPLWKVYFLLHELTTTSIRSELSSPQNISTSGAVAGYTDRIIIDVSGFAGGPDGSHLPSDADSPAPLPDIDIRRRSA